MHFSGEADSRVNFQTEGRKLRRQQEEKQERILLGGIEPPKWKEVPI